MHRFLKYGEPVSGFRSNDLKGNFLQYSDARLEESERLYQKCGKKTSLLGWHEIRHQLFGTVEFDKQVCLPTVMQSNC